jgi:S-layer family protein
MTQRNVSLRVAAWSTTRRNGWCSSRSQRRRTNAIAGAVLGYKLQVSPAPANATFGDVPTSHPFFQFVEALAKSGITGGCGGGNYCPDNPVTRGQMAVFGKGAAVPIAARPYRSISLSTPRGPDGPTF